MFPMEDGGKPKSLPASRALLVPAAYSDANASILAAIIAEVFVLDLVVRTLHDPRAIQYPQITEQDL